MSNYTNSADTLRDIGEELKQTLESLQTQFEETNTDLTDKILVTPLSLLVVANYLNRLHFIEIINERLTWDSTQWKYSPGVLAQLIVLSTFIPSSKKIALFRIHEAFS